MELTRNRREKPGPDQNPGNRAPSQIWIQILDSGKVGKAARRKSYQIFLFWNVASPNVDGKDLHLFLVPT